MGAPRKYYGRLFVSILVILIIQSCLGCVGAAVESAESAGFVGRMLAAAAPELGEELGLAEGLSSDIVWLNDGAGFISRGRQFTINWEQGVIRNQAQETIAEFENGRIYK